MSKCLSCGMGNHGHCTNPSKTSIVRICCCGFVAPEATGLTKPSKSSGEPPTLRKLAPVSPNTNIDELLTRDGITELVDYSGGKVIRIKPSVIQEAKALISAAKIEELKKLLEFNAAYIDRHDGLRVDGLVSHITIEERIKELESFQESQ